jgi:predicted TIM-barrel fold metal-dependent hydrolase
MPAYRNIAAQIALVAFSMACTAAGCRNEQPASPPQAEVSPATNEPQGSELPTITADDLLANPEIINAHEHLMDRDHILANLEKVNEEVGIVATALMGTSRFTFYLDKSSFIEYHENNEFLCKLARQNPGKYYAFVTFDPLEDQIVPKLQDYLKKGATGVKLYLGHGANIGDGTPFHRFPLDDPRILPLYEFCERNRVPILYHINMHPTKFGEEARRVFDKYPDLPIILPHFGLILGRPTELDQFMADYPNIVIDISFGHHEFQRDGLSRISNNPARVRDFVVKYQDRILYGSDVVVTGGKTPEYMADSFLAYRCMLELPVYRFFIRAPNGKVYNETFKGLELPDEVLRKIYHGNFKAFLAKTKERPAFGPLPPENGD